MANLRQGSFGEYYGSTYSESDTLTMSEMEVNAQYIYRYLSDKGWTKNAIAGMLGNIQAESSINSGRWQSDIVNNLSGGYGLVQWTPASKYIDWCVNQDLHDPSQMDHNLARIIYEVDNGLQWIATDTYNITFKEFTKSNESVGYLARAFLLNYERPADQSLSVQAQRSVMAENWYSVLTGSTPQPDPDLPFPSYKKKKRKSNFMLLYVARKRREEWIRTK